MELDMYHYDIMTPTSVILKQDKIKAWHQETWHDIKSPKDSNISHPETRHDIIYDLDTGSVIQKLDITSPLHHYDLIKVLDSYLIMFLIYVYK